MDIIVENVSKLYGLQKAVDNVSFRVKPGEILGFLGPNGAGKTTTMKAITCFLTPNEGDIHVGGYSIRQNPQEVKKQIGYLPENNPLYHDMAIIDYLKFVAGIQGVTKDKINERVAKMIRVCGLSKEKHKKIGELSKGYQQRVGLAQALIHDPQFLVLDEPTTGLDPNQIIEIRELIKDIGKEKTVILSSHILAEVEATCDRVLIINNGKIVADGTPEELRKRSQGSEILHIRIEEGGSNDIFEALNTIDSVEIVDTRETVENGFEVQSKKGMSSRRAIFDLCKQKNWYLTELIPVETKLEDVFREVTNQ